MQRKIAGRRKGFTLVEMLTVIIIFGISVGLFYTTFYYNWLTLNTYASRANLMQEMDQVFDVVTEKVREANGFTPSGTSTVALTPSGEVLSFDANGVFTLQSGATTQILSYSVDPDPAKSGFSSDGEALNLQLTLKEPTPGQDAIFSSSIQVYPRNRNAN